MIELKKDEIKQLKLTIATFVSETKSTNVYDLIHWYEGRLLLVKEIEERK